MSNKVRPIPPAVLIALISALCALCAWQWHREGELRALAAEQARELADTATGRDELLARTRVADAEILRLTGALTELRANSVSGEDHPEAQDAISKLSDAVTRLETLVTGQNEAIAKANESIITANQSIENLTAGRDALAEKLNALTARYNKLANPE